MDVKRDYDKAPTFPPVFCVALEGVGLTGHWSFAVTLAGYCHLSHEFLPNVYRWQPWWRHQMETFSALLAICVGNSPVPGEFPTQRPVTRGFDVFFDMRLNKRMSKQSWGWWFETLSRPLWRHCNECQHCPAYCNIYQWPISTWGLGIDDKEKNEIQI